MNTSSECEDIITTSGTTSATESGTETSTLSTETSTLTTTSSTTSVTNIADEDLCSWAINDYQKKTGIVPANAEITARSENACEITLTDENGNILNVYTVDPKTGTGTDSSNAEVNLPQGLGCCHFQRSDLRNLAPESSAVPGNASHGSDHGVCLSPDGTAAVCHGVPQSQQSDPGARHRAKRRAAVHSIPPSASGNHCQSPAASGARGVPDTCCRWNRGDSLEADAHGGGAFRRVTCEQKCKSFIFVYNLAAWLCYNNKRHCIRA